MAIEKNKKNGCLGVLIIFVVLFFMVKGCVDNTESKYQTEKFKVEQIGYFKENNMRVFTYVISSEQNINRNNVPQELIDLMKKTGGSDMHTIGKITQTFFYIDKAPDITLIKTYPNAINKAFDNKPLAIYAKNMDGKISFDLNPK